MNKYYAIISEQEEGGYIIDFPDLEGCFSQGETVVEAIENGREALALVLEGINEAPSPSSIGEMYVFALHGQWVGHKHRKGNSFQIIGLRPKEV